MLGCGYRACASLGCTPTASLRMTRQRRYEKMCLRALGHRRPLCSGIRVEAMFTTSMWTVTGLYGRNVLTTKGRPGSAVLVPKHLTFPFHVVFISCLGRAVKDLLQTDRKH